MALMLLIIPVRLDAQEPSSNRIPSEPSYCYIFVVGCFVAPEHGFNSHGAKKNGTVPFWVSTTIAAASVPTNRVIIKTVSRAMSFLTWLAPF